MKSVISAGGIFILIITMIIMSCAYTNSVAEEMLQILYKNENNIAKNNWQTAQGLGEDIEHLWRKNRNIMVTLFNHTIIEKVDASIEKMQKSIEMQKKEDFFYESVNLKLLAESLVEQQKISVGNIF